MFRRYMTDLDELMYDINYNENNDLIDFFNYFMISLIVAFILFLFRTGTLLSYTASFLYTYFITKSFFYTLILNVFLIFLITITK